MFDKKIYYLPGASENQSFKKRNSKFFFPPSSCKTFYLNTNEKYLQTSAQKRRKYLPFIIYLFTLQTLLNINLYSQPILEWVKLYPDTNSFSSGAAALALDDSGNVYVTGHSELNGGAYTTIKYNSSGIQEWFVHYFGEIPGGRFAHDIAVDKQSNVYVTGYSYRTGSYFDFCTLKYNTNGEQQWIRFYDGSIHDIEQARKIAVDNAGNIYVSGFSTVIGYGAKIYVTIKYSSFGDTVWLRTYVAGDIGTDITDLKIDENDNIYITGECDANAVTIKYDSSGNQVWANSYWNGGDHSTAKSLTLDIVHNIIVTGYTEFYSNRRGSFTIKYSPSGAQQWVKTIEPAPAMNSYHQSNSVVADDSGNVYISGLIEDSQPRRIFMQKYSAEGDSIWHITYAEDTLANQFTHMNNDKNNNIYITGHFDRYGVPFHVGAIGILKYDYSGVLKWKTFLGYTSTALSTESVKLDENFNIYLGGTKDPLGPTPYQMLTIKYSQLVGLQSNGENKAQTFSLEQNYPNPFNTVTKIRFNIPNLSLLNESIKWNHVLLRIYDILGREVATLINLPLRSGTYEINWDASNFSSGVYFYSLEAENYLDTKKMLLIK